MAWGQLIKLGKIGDKVDKVLFRGNIKDDGSIDCMCRLAPFCMIPLIVL